jgi:hypothetical protein
LVASGKVLSLRASDLRGSRVACPRLSKQIEDSGATPEAAIDTRPIQ